MDTMKGSELLDGSQSKKRSSMPGKGADSSRKLRQLASKHSMETKGTHKKSSEGLLVPLKKQTTQTKDKQENLNSTLKQIK